MGMDGDRSEWGWAGMMMDRIARMGMGREGQYLPGWTGLLGWGWAWMDRIAWMGMGRVGHDCRDGDWWR